MITVINKDKKTGAITFEISRTTPAFVNTIRRMIVDNVPTMAADEIEIIQNTSALYDEMIANRIGLVPLTTDLKGYKIATEEDAKDDPRCIQKLSLKTKGPCTVYSKDLQSGDPKIKPVYENMPIVKLLKGQQLELVATARLGLGKDHVKHSPGLVWYKYKPTIKVNNNHPKLEEYQDKYPEQIFKKGKIDAKVIEEQDLYDAVEGINKDIVDIQHDDANMIVTIEPWGQLSVAQMVQTAADEMTHLLEDFAKSI